MKKHLILFLFFIYFHQTAFCWGFFAHRRINHYAIFLLPPEMLLLYKPQLDFIVEHAIDPDKRRYLVKQEGPRHYIDIDRYGKYPFDSLPRNWTMAVHKYGADSVHAHGIVPWWIPVMLARLTGAFREKNQAKILKYSAEIGHYIADAHVPLHASSNHNGQYTGQKGIHGFWESRIPELLADTQWDFFIGKASFLKDPSAFIWQRVLESAAASDTVLNYEQKLSATFPLSRKFGFEPRNGTLVRQYSEEYTRRYDAMLNGMVERRMRQAIFAVASFWYTAWVNAGQPDLRNLTHTAFSAEDSLEFEKLNAAWKGDDHG